MSAMELDSAQADRVASMLAADASASGVLDLVAQLDVPDAWLVAGAVMATVFNALTDRPSGYGVADWDIAFCDPGDLSEEREHAVAQRADALREQMALSVSELEVTNQARVHLWYHAQFHRPCPAYRATAEAVARFQTFCSCVGARRREPGGAIDVIAPHGLSDLLSLRVRANRVQAPRSVYDAKVARWRMAWPELDIHPWSD